MSEQEMQSKQETALAAPVRRGFEGGLDPEDMIIPRLMLIQNTPPKTVTIDKKTCPPGSLINSLTACPLQLGEKESVVFVPIIVGRKWIRWNAQKESDRGYDKDYEIGAKIWESKDPRDERVIKEGEWGKDASGKLSIPPLATKILEFLSIVIGEEMPLVISFAKTSFKAGKQLASMCQYSGKPDMFAFKYRLFAVEDMNDKKQQYYTMGVAKLAEATPEEFAKAEAMYKSFVGKEIKVHGDEDNSEPVSPKQPWE